MYKVTFNNKNKVFFNALKTSVDEYFTNNNLKKTGNWKLYSKTVILIPLAMLVYAGLLFLPLNLFTGILLSIVMGLVLASIGFNVMHDACHGSYSSKKWVNDVLSLTMNALGGSAFMWKMKHNILHHTYTNVDGLDDDINNMPFMRQCRTQPLKPMHRFQAYYMFVLYGFTSLFIFISDYTKYFSKKIHHTALNPMSAKEHLIFWISKAMYWFFYIILPIMLVGFKAWFLGFMVMQLTLGLTLAIVFQLAHVVEHMEFEAADVEPKKIENEWAIHQVKTTADFAPTNKIVSWFVGGLNFQVEHHLFPRISHIHYPDLRKIVEDTCRQFNITYHYFPTMRAAIASHYRMMDSLGKTL
jgi:linoleoyl-CoA desaturase